MQSTITLNQAANADIHAVVQMMSQMCIHAKLSLLDAGGGENCVQLVHIRDGIKTILGRVLPYSDKVHKTNMSYL